MAAIKFPHEYTTTLPKAVIRVDDQWYDCSAWRHSHPGGAQLIDQFHNKDATDAFYSLHSQEAIDQLKRMKGKPVDAKELHRGKLSEDFEQWRQQLHREGWFKRNWMIDFGLFVLPVIALCFIGTIISSQYPVISTLLIGFAMQQAGWIGHDYTHGRGRLSRILGCGLGGLINGFSSAWWSNKHNTHHTFPNRLEYDSDIHNEPILHLWFPDASKDVWYRKYQHIYYPVAYSFLYASWRMQSIQFVLGSKNWLERILLAINYCWLAYLPWKVAIGSILVGGFMVAFVVTVNHQTEEILATDAPYNFILDQYATTRGVHCADWFMEYVFGGMQYQLEHHLFPTMPRYYYPALRPLIKKFAAEHNLPHHISGVAEITKMNYEVMKKYSAERPGKRQ